MASILQLDAHGTPQAWLTYEETASLYATDDVLYSLGDPLAVLHGGYNAHTGLRSIITLAPIVFTRGTIGINLFDLTPAFTRRKLFQRDRNVCAYCGDELPSELLECEHRLPISRGGRTDWMNCVTACRPCNQRKGDRTPEEAGMELLYAPYVPSLAEDMILRNRQILVDQMDFLRRRLPKGSRWWTHG